jgi:hypothetical protein
MFVVACRKVDRNGYSTLEMMPNIWNTMDKAFDDCERLAHIFAQDDFYADTEGTLNGWNVVNDTLPNKLLAEFRVMEMNVLDPLVVACHIWLTDDASAPRGFFK